MYQPRKLITVFFITVFFLIRDQFQLNDTYEVVEFLNHIKAYSVLHVFLNLIFTSQHNIIYIICFNTFPSLAADVIKQTPVTVMMRYQYVDM